MKKIIQNNMFKKICVIGMTFCAIVAISINPSGMDMTQASTPALPGLIALFYSEMGPVELPHVIAALLIAFWFQRFLFRPEDKVDLSAAAVSFALALFLLMGMSLSTFHNCDFIFLCRKQFVIALIVFIGIWALLYTLIKFLYSSLDRYIIVPQNGEKTKTSAAQFCYEHPQACFFFGLLLCWFVQMIPYFPGSVPHDGRFQLNQFYGYQMLNLHHPYYATMLMGWIYNFGKHFWGTTGGCVCYVLFQSFFAAIVFSRICSYIYKKLKSALPAILCFLFYAFVPAWWTYMQTIEKDAISFIASAWFVFEYMLIFFRDDHTTRAHIRLVLSGVLACLFRNETKFIIIPAMMMLILLMNEHRIKALASTLALFALFTALNAVPTHFLGLTSVNQVEALSIPIQQIARYVTFYEDELTEYEKSVIDRVVQYNGIPERYNPEISDPIKNRYRDTTKEEFSDFFNLWQDKMKTHPGVYATATLNNMFGYVDPFYFYDGLVSFQLYTKESLGDFDSGIVYSEYAFSASVRRAYNTIVEGWEKIPIISFLVNPGFYTWVGFILLGALLRRKKWKEMLCFLAPVLMTAVCFASPVNGLLRYSLPIMAITPLYVCLVMQIYGKE